MSRIRIVCRRPDQPTRAAVGPIVNAILPSLPDCQFFAIGDDGSELEMTNISRVTFVVAADGEPAKAMVEFINVEVDVEALCDETS